MPFDWRNRFTPSGFRAPREVAEKCNALGDAAFQAVSEIEAKIDDLESRGAMDLAGLRPGTDITNAFQDVVGYTSEPVTAKNVALTLSTGQFVLQIAGPWRLDFTFNITFTPSPAVRTTQLRAFNVTKSAIVGTPIPMIIEANDTGLDRMRFGVFDLPAADVGDSLVMQIGGASTLVGVTWFDHTLALKRV